VIKIDSTTLRVFDSLHDLGMTEADFVEIEDEAKHTERSGLWIQYIKDKNVVGVNHDSGHKIFINSYEKEIERGRIAAKPRTRILLKTMITFDVPEEVYILHRTAKYKGMDTSIKKTANNLAELKEIIITRFSDENRYSLGGKYSDVEIDGKAEDRRQAKDKKPLIIQKELSAIAWLFNEEYKDCVVESRMNIPRIIKVWTLKNKRLALFQENECWSNKRCMGLFSRWEDVDRVTYSIRTYTPKNPEYNYVAPGREVALSNNSRYAEVWVCDELIDKINNSDLESIQSIIITDPNLNRNANRIDDDDEDEDEENNTVNHGFYLLTPDKLLALQSKIRMVQNTTRRAEEESEAKKLLIENIRKQFQAGKITRNGITITKNSIKYEDLVIKGGDIEKFVIWKGILDLEEFDFNKILEAYFSFTLDLKQDVDYGYNTDKLKPGIKIGDERKICVGKINLHIKMTKQGVFINDKRVMKDEVEVVVNKSINYKSQKEYDEYLNSVSKTSLKLQDIISRGYFQFELAMNNNDDCSLSFDTRKLVIQIPVIREKDKTFVVLEDEKYSIRNISSFLKLDANNNRSNAYYEGDGLQRVINQLNKSVKDISAKNIGLIITKGAQKYKSYVVEKQKVQRDKLAKSKLFIAHAVKVTKAKVVKGGYLVKGISGTVYSLNKDSLSVYTINEKGLPDKHLCIVDSYEARERVSEEEERLYDEWRKNDKVAQRLLMLSQDVKVAREVYEKGDHMDKWWKELIEREVET
jgi:hypothetical protein